MTEQVLTSTLEIGYEVSGPPDGAPLVAVHGWPDDPSCWDATLPDLLIAGYRVVRPYLRGFGPTRFRSPDTPRSGQIGALGHDLADFLDALELRGVVLVGHAWGAPGGLRGRRVVPAPGPADRRAVRWSCHEPSGCAAELAAHPRLLVRVVRGRRAMREDRRRFSRYLWQTWSPSWTFDDAAFDRAAPVWDNDDWPQIAVHAYQHRWGETDGDPAYQDIERRLLEPAPVVRPTVVIHGAEDADNLPETTEHQEELFHAGYQRLVLDGIGHFPPREAPQQVTEAVITSHQ